MPRLFKAASSAWKAAGASFGGIAVSPLRVNFHVIGAGRIARRKTIPGMLKAKNCRLAAVMNPSGIAGAWRQDLRTGAGGAMIDMVTHLFDVPEYFAGPLRRVGALTGNLVQKCKSEDASTTVLYDAGHNGANGDFPQARRRSRPTP